MALEFSLDSLAVVAVFVANAAVMVITIGTYWRMTRYEQSNHIHIVNALRETRDAGREMKIAAHELIRIAERGGVGGGGGGLGPAELGQLDELMKLVRGLLDAYGGQDDAAEQGDEPEVRWPDSAHEMSSELMEQLRRSHRNEVDRLVAQRRRMQVELGLTRERLDDALKQLSASRHRGGSGSSGGGPELQVLRQQLDSVRLQLQQAQDRQYLAETRAEKAERMTTKLQKELEEMALAPKPSAQNSQAPEMMKLLEREALMLREQLAEAERTIQKLRAELAALAANPPEHADPQAVDDIRERLEREVEQLRGKIDDLQDALKRNQVEKDFIEEHYLKEAQKNDEARLEAEAAAAAMEFVGKTAGGR